MVKFHVHRYSIAKLKYLFVTLTKTPTKILESKIHLTYFENYFSELNAETIVVEYNYVDHDFLEDYAEYYVKCFHTYERFCVRLHFFSKRFTTEDFKNILLSKSPKINNDSLNEVYLGFIVVKQIPVTFIGRTCLKVYPSEHGRIYPFQHNYKVNLFGLILNVKTLAYQEQDSVVAACASSSIWTAFQATAFLFQHSVPTPVEITKSALKFFPYANRHLPNKGLTPEQMAHAIRNVGLEPYLIDADSHDIVMATVYAYQKAEIPVVFGVNLFERHGVDDTVIGKHAVTISGYRLEGNRTGFASSGFYLKSSRIVKIYAHDDQVGPFARMELLRNKGFFTTSWPDKDGNLGNVFADPLILVLPLYNKLRIPFYSIMNLVFQLDKIIKTIDDNVHLGINDIEWEIFLSNSNVLKGEIYKSGITDDEKLKVLCSNLPKYVWRAIANWNGEKFELVFDTTDIEQGEIFIGFIKYSDNLYRMVKTIAENINLDDVTSVQLQSIFEQIKK